VARTVPPAARILNSIPGDLSSVADYFPPPGPPRVLVGPGPQSGPGGGPGGNGVPGLPGPTVTGPAMGAPTPAAGAPTPAAGATSAAPTPASTSLSLRSSAGRPVSGQSVQLMATVSPVPDGGTMRFLARGATIAGCAAVPVDHSTGQAVCTMRFARAGAIEIEAIYSGDPSFAGSHSAAVTEAVLWSVRLDGSPRSSAGLVSSKLTCLPRSGGCRITVALTVLDAGAAVGGQGTGHMLTVGQRTVTLLGGATQTIAVGLSAPGRARLARSSPLTATETIELTVAGQRATVTTIQVSIQR
jgi:hypothetical protein